ncbi:hypothetical protein P152DRAFT_451823 [Eremomyces bilateralis CBS 781.70]|uniref:Uncharacterized protein n=1 Tax=Eremomyces bilateralis CBS 781.70 TaxID=1392243 RepID=A0A6G1FV89_9PEZI|nr:uncharacterized protein P152DRAFT_451823 [Eremomyces bilateralis CBS 781.70]KAF1809626.1 hypothetical protein P152DRAFT_451823 [Eremomyces bilateralis CBS 781.70]
MGPDDAMAQPVLSVDEYGALPISIRGTSLWFVESLEWMQVRYDRVASSAPRAYSGVLVLTVLAARSSDANLVSHRRKKYFSSLERLRIAENHAASQLLVVPGRPTPLDRIDVSPPSTRPSTGYSYLSHSAQHSSGRVRKGRHHSRRRSVSVGNDRVITRADAERYLALPEKLKRAQFSKEEQYLLEGCCTSILLEKLDGNISDQASGTLTAVSLISLDYQQHDQREDSIIGPSRDGSTKMARDSFQDHEPVDRSMPSTHARKYSLRRNFSISTTNPTGRTSTSSAPSALPSPLFTAFPSHRRSRNNSLIVPPLEFVTTPQGCDATALHYQDPEARMKLRQYLASPQKFDEAIEFGFPASAANNENTGRHSTEPTRISTSHSRQRRILSAANDAQTFLRNDDFSFLDNSDILSDDSGSMVYHDRSTAATTPAADLDSASDSDSAPASPVTPNDTHPLSSHPSNPEVDTDTIANVHAFVDRVTASKFANIHEDILPPFTVNLSVAPAPLLTSPSPKTSAGARSERDMWDEALSPGGREMTLRMTLTRPDLRADEETIYGWHDGKSRGKRSGSISYGLTTLSTSGAAAIFGSTANRQSKPYDPLALEALPQFTDDATGEHGAFAVKPPKSEGGLMRRMLRRVAGSKGIATG